MNAEENRDRPLVAIAEPIDPVCLDWLCQRCDCCGIESIENADALIVRTSTVVDRALLESASNLKVIGRAGVGVDHIDLESCAARGIVVVHTPDANTDAVVEFVFAEVLSALRSRPEVSAPLDSAAWELVRERVVAPRQLRGLTLGVLGFGRIGSRVGAVGQAFGMEVVYHDLLEIPHEQRAGAQPVGLESLLSAADVLSIHVDGRASNRGLIGTAELSLCKAEAVVLNTSRGFVVDVEALAAFLRENPRARAICDVHEPEPIGSENPLLGLGNARLTPHVASATAEAKRAMSWVVRDVWRVLSGEPPVHVAKTAPDARSLPAE